MNSALEFLRDWLRLLDWVFFKPSALRAHIKEIAPESADEGMTIREFLRLFSDNSKLRVFLLRTLIFALLTWLVCALLIDQLTLVFVFKFGLAKSFRIFLFSVACGVAGGVAVGVSRGVVEGALFSVAIGVAIGVAFGIAVGIAGGGVAGGVVAGVAIGVAVGVAGGVAGGAAVGASFGVAFGVLIVVAFGVLAGVGRGVSFGVVFGVALVVATLRLPFYVIELQTAIRAYRRAISCAAPEHELLRSPVYQDEFLILPQPFLSSLLLCVGRKDLDAGLRHFGRVASNPFQRWAVQRAMRTLLEQDRIPFFSKLDRLLTTPYPYIQIGADWKEKERAEDPYFTTRLLLAELMDRWPKPRRYDYRHWPNDYLARAMTFWLRPRGKSRYAPLADAYFTLLREAEWVADRASMDESDEQAGFTEDDLLSLPWAVETLKNARELPHAEEFYQSLRLSEAGLRCESLQDVARLRDEFAPLFEINNPLRPQIVTVFRRLRDAVIDAASFLAVAHEITRRDALLKAQGVLEEARRAADEVYEPDRSLLLAVIEQWRRMFAVEGGRVAERVEVEALPNPYIVGRPVRPEDGRLFAGRREEFLAIEEKLQTGVGLVIYGQRRIGKSSILLHLRERLPHSLAPVYLNLQQLMANTTGGFLRAVSNEIVKQLRDKLMGLPAPLSADEFDREPFLSFNQSLDEIERRLTPDQRVLLSFDEFEELEQRVKAGRIEKEIFAYLRGVTQTGRGFTLLFAGLHTLEQMTREYWNPFFQSVQTVRIGYLSESDARQLIIDPIAQFPLSYEEEAIDRIVAVTNSHPYLMQNVCHNLVNRLNDPLQRSNRARVEDVEAVLEKTLETGGYYFDDYVWNWSSADERVALSLLAEAGEWAGFTTVEKHLGREAALDATRNLVARHVLQERTDRNELVFRFQIPLSRMWAQKTKPSARVLMERGRL
jgi:AAA+ ATPase superfamily predicted ATPase